MVKARKIIKTQKDIRTFLIDCGFKPAWSEGNWLQAYMKKIKDEDLYEYQINGCDISDIETLDETVFFTENGIDPSITWMYRYSEEYPNLKAMVEAETKRGIDFSGGLKKWSITCKL